MLTEPAIWRWNSEVEAISALSMDHRFTMANMAIEAGGKNGIIAPDETTLAILPIGRKGLTASINPMMMKIIMR